MAHVYAQDGESIESLLKRFSKKVSTAGILQDVKLKEFYDKPSNLARKERNSAKSRIEKQRQKVMVQLDYESNNKFRPRRPAGTGRPLHQGEGQGAPRPNYQNSSTQSSTNPNSYSTQNSSTQSSTNPNSYSTQGGSRPQEKRTEQSTSESLKALQDRFNK